MKVLIRVDSSSKIGHGQLRRSLLLAKSYSDVSFACRELEGALLDIIPYEVFLLDSMSVEELAWLIKEEKFELLIIDHYDIGYEEELYLKKSTGVQILSFDDELKPHYCDTLLNVNPFAKPNLYEKLVPNFCQIQCGFAHSLIRDEFYEEAKIKREKIYDYFLCFGSSDRLNLSPKIALELGENQKIFIATTSANLNLNALQHFCAKNSKLTLGVDIKDFARKMNESKKLIISASNLVNEAIFLKANFKAICTSKHQFKIAQWLKSNGKEVEFQVKGFV